MILKIVASRLVVQEKAICLFALVNCKVGTDPTKLFFVPAAAILDYLPDVHFPVRIIIISLATVFQMSVMKREVLVRELLDNSD